MSGSYKTEVDACVIFSTGYTLNRELQTQTAGEFFQSTLGRGCQETLDGVLRE